MRRWLLDPHFSRLDGVVISAATALLAQSYWLLALLLIVIGASISITAALRGEGE